MRVILKDEINGLIEDYARLTVIETENKILADIIDSDWDELCEDVRKQEEEILEREKVKKENIDGAVCYAGKVYFKDVDTIDRKSTRLNSSHSAKSRMPSSA